MPNDEPTWDNTTEVEPTWDNTAPVQTQQETPPQPSRIPSAYIPPDVEKEVTQKFDEAHPILGNAAQALEETISGFVPRSVEQVGQLLTPVVSAVEDIGKSGMSLRDVLFGGQSPTQAAETNYPESLQLRQAEQTPPFSKERFAAGFGTLANIGMAAAIGRGLPLRDVLFGRENPTVTAATESVVEPTLRPEDVGASMGRSWTITPPTTEVSPIVQQTNQGLAALEARPQPEQNPLAPNAFQGISQGAEDVRRIALNQQADVEAQRQAAQSPDQWFRSKTNEAAILQQQADTMREAGQPAAAKLIQDRIDTINQELKQGFKPQEPQTGEPNASTQPSTESVSQPEVRTPVGEGTPLRQQGETTGARQEIPTEETAARQGTETQVAQPQTTTEIRRQDIPEDASVRLKLRTADGGEAIRDMNAREAEGIFTKERSSLRTLLDCLG